MNLRKMDLKTIALQKIKGKVTAMAMMLLTLGLVIGDARGQSGTAADRHEANTPSELTVLLRQFLDNAGRGDRAGFERFFADDVIYTRSSGVVMNKVDILRGIEKLKPTEESKTRYSAEDIVLHDYGDTAVVAFRLVAETQRKDRKVETMNYRNTGMFLRRNGAWQVVAWQSTKAATPTAETSR